MQETHLNLPGHGGAQTVSITVPAVTLSVEFTDGFTFDISNAGVDVIDEEGTYVLTDATLAEAVDYVYSLDKEEGDN